MSDDKFNTFIRHLLIRAKVTDEYIAKMMTPENMKLWKNAFTHKSLGTSNYEYDEFVGDTVVNLVIVLFSSDRYPDIINVAYTTKLKHYLSSKKILAVISKKYGIDEFIRYNPIMNKMWAHDKNPMDNVEYRSMLEDTIEAICGVLIKMVRTIKDKRGKFLTYGTGFELCKNFLYTFLDESPMKIEYGDLWDGNTRIKEMYESHVYGLHWPKRVLGPGARDDGGEYAYVITKLADGRFQVILYGWPLGDKIPVRANRVQLAREVDKDRKVAQQAASSKALEVLDRVYNIRDVPVNPYVPNKWKPKRYEEDED